ASAKDGLGDLGPWTDGTDLGERRADQVLLARRANDASLAADEDRFREHQWVAARHGRRRAAAAACRDEGQDEHAGQEESTVNHEARTRPGGRSAAPRASYRNIGRHAVRAGYRSRDSCPAADGHED